MGEDEGSKWTKCYEFSSSLSESSSKKTNNQKKNTDALGKLNEQGLI